MIIKKKSLIAGVLALSCGFGSLPAAADQDPMQIFTMVYMASQMCVMSTYMGLVSVAVASGTHDYVHAMNKERRQEADREIDSRYHSEHEILQASQQADAKIKENQEMIKKAKGNKLLQKECKRNIGLWMRMKERAEEIQTRQTIRNARLSI